MGDLPATALCQTLRHETRQVQNLLEKTDAAIISTVATQTLLATAASQLENNAFAAYGSVLEAETELNTARGLDSDYATKVSLMAEARERLGRMMQWFRDRADHFAAPVTPGGVIAWEQAVDVRALDTGLAAIADLLEATTKNYYPLALQLEGKQAATLAMADYTSMRDNLASAETQLASWRRTDPWTPGGPTPPSIAILEIGDGAEDAFEFARFALASTSKLRFSGSTFVDQNGTTVSLSNFDTVWIHYEAPSGTGFLDQAKAVPVTGRAITTALLDALKGYVNSGGGLLLSGHSAHYAVAIGYETVPPNDIAVDKFGFIASDHYATNPEVNLYGELGVRARPEYKNHPMFDYVAPYMDAGGGFGFRNDSILRRQQYSSWRYKAGGGAPAGATHVIGQRDWNIRPPGRTAFYDLFEYQPATGGKVIVIGLPYFDFDRTLGDDFRARNTNHLHRLRLWMRGVVQYLASDAKFAQAPPAISAPHCRNIGRKALLPALTWSATPHDGNDNDLVAKVFDEKRYFPDFWRVTCTASTSACATPVSAGLSIDFGGTYSVDQVHVVTNTTKGDVTHAVLKVKNQGSRVFDETVGTFDGSGHYGVTFRFATPRIISGLEMSALQNAADGSLGINEVLIYTTPENGECPPL